MNIVHDHSICIRSPLRELLLSHTRQPQPPKEVGAYLRKYQLIRNLEFDHRKHGEPWRAWDKQINVVSRIHDCEEALFLAGEQFA